MGLVLVSHSRALAQAAVALIREAAANDVAIAAAGGTGEGHEELGTDPIDIQAAIEKALAKPDEDVLVLMDMGSAILSTEMAQDFLGEADRPRVHLCAAPLVEGGLAAAVQFGAGASIDEAKTAALRSLLPKEDHLGSTGSPKFEAKELIPRDGSQTFRLENRLGLHMRPAASLVRLVKTFTSAQVQIRNVNNGRGPFRADSLVDLSRLHAQQGDELAIDAAGADAARATSAIIEFLQALRFEDQEPSTPDVLPPGKQPVSPGIAIGHLLWLDLARAATGKPFGIFDDTSEIRSLKDGVTQASSQLRQRASTGANSAATVELVRFQLELLEDPELFQKAEQKIRSERQPAAAAWEGVLTELAAEQSAAANDYLSARAADYRELGLLVAAELSGRRVDFSHLKQDTILVCDELYPFLFDAMRDHPVVGAIQLDGGSLSHGAILARAAGLPAVANARADRADLSRAVMACIDGSTGEIRLDPSEDELRAWRARSAELQTAQAAGREAAGGPAVTRDGVAITVLANAGSRSNVESVTHYGGEGIGLFRSEFLYQEFAQLPDEPAQIRAFQEALQSQAGRKVIIRLLDVGGDKPISWLSVQEETNPFLGVRGIRLLQKHPDFLHSHLRALLQLGFPVQLMIPMVNSVGEVQYVRQQLAACHDELQQEDQPHQWPVSLGIMVETPASLILFDQLAEACDFASLGTNDLTQYLLCAERGNPALALYSDSLHPAILRACHQLLASPAAAKIPVSICGELASDPAAIPLLLSVGFRTLSVIPTAIPAVKQHVRRMELAKMKEGLIELCYSVTSSRELRDRLAILGEIEPI